MAVRPLSFGIRFNDKRPGGKRRTVRLDADHRDPKRYVLKVLNDNKTQRREHASLSWAIRDFAVAWRNRLN
jgi:hypothetical protein